MAGFAMCADCRREYEDPADRRFHAEPIACPACGPRLTTAARGRRRRCCATAAILAVKGLGGYHLACDATDEAAVARLRARKHRDDKPFAVMTAAPGALADARPPRSWRCLRSRERPIVLVRRRPGGAGRRRGRAGQPVARR